MKLAYINVVARTGWAAALIGAMVAWDYNGAPINWINLIAVLGTILVMQGLVQHSLDTIMDTDSAENSSFRKDVKMNFNEKQLKYIFKMGIIFATLVTLVGAFVIGRWFFIIVFALGAMCIVLYAVTHIESYSFTAFSLCSIAGFLSQNDINFLIGTKFFIEYGPLFSAFVMLLFVYRIGQLIYRIDDYLTLMSKAQIIAYYRNNLRKLHHPVQLGIIALMAWHLGWWHIAWIASGTELFLWYNYRHNTCNNVHCFKNEIRLIETKKKPCKGNIVNCMKTCPVKCKLHGPISWKTLDQPYGPDLPSKKNPY